MGVAILYLMSLVRLLVPFFILSFGSSALSAIPYKVWREKLESVYHRTPKAVELKRKVRSAKMSEEATARHAPFSVSVAMTRTNTPKELVDNLGRTEDLTTTPGIRMGTRGGFTTSLDVSQQNLDYFADGTDKIHSNPQSVTLSLSQELLKEGSTESNGSDMSSLRASLAQAKASQLQAEYELRSDRINFLQLVTQIFLNECKIIEIEKQRKGIQETVKVSKILLDSKAIAYEEYLGILDLNNNFVRQRAGFEENRETLVQSALKYGGEIRRAAEKLSKIKPLCEFDIEKTFNRAIGLLIPEVQIEAAAKAQPTYLGQELLRQAAAFGVNIAKLGTAPSLVLSGSGIQKRLGLESANREGLVYSVGATFSWNLPGDKGDYSIEAARASLLASESTVRSSYFSGISGINEVQISIKAQRPLIKILKTSIAGSKKLLEVYAAKRAIGQIDSRGLTDANNNILQATFSLFDSWSKLELATQQMELIRSYYSPRQARPKKKRQESQELDL